MQENSFFKKLLSLVIVFILSYLPYSTSYTFNTYQIKDLETLSLASEDSAWTASGLINAGVKIKTCGGIQVLGGPNVLGSTITSYNHYFERIYTSLSSHNMIYYSLSFYAFDSWSKADLDSFQLYFDGRIINGWKFDVTDHNVNLCSGSVVAQDLKVQIFGRVFHSADTLTFRVISKLDEKSDLESFGIRDLTFLFVQAPETTTEEITGRPVGNPPVVLYTNQKACASGEYQPFGSSSCISCHANCDECFGPTERECYTCKPSKTFNNYGCITAACHSSCAICFGDTESKCLKCNTGYYLANNNTCVAPCAAPLVKTSDGVQNFCETRCTADQFAYANGSCLSTCTYPLKPETVATFKLCTNPCPSQYLFWDQTCVSNCNLPWRIRSNPGVDYCEYPCQLNEYAYWNGTCHSSCPFPLQLSFTNSYKFCKSPCLSGQYVYEDASCLNDCTFPLSSKEESGVKYCNFGCPSSRFLYWNGSCLPECKAPFRIEGTSLGNYCQPPCASGTKYYYEDTKECKSECDMVPWKDNTGLFLECLAFDPEKPGFFINIFLTASADPGSLSFLAVAKPLEYIRYLDIAASPRLQMFMKNYGRTLLSLRYGYGMPEQMRGEFVKQPMPYIFESRGLHSSFLVNFWEEITSYAIMIGVMVLFMAVEQICERLNWKVLQAVFRALKIVVKWNFFLILIATGLDNIILYSILEFTTFEFVSFLSVISLLVSLAVVALAIAFLTNLIYLIPLFKAARADAAVTGSHHKYLNFLIQWEGFQVLYRGFKDDEFHKEYFFLVYTVRLALPMIIACSLRGIPLLQAFIYLLISIGILLYLCLTKPLKKRINHIQLVILESIILVINFDLIILAILDLAGDSSQGAGAVFGDFVIFGDLCVNLLAVIFLVIKVAHGIKTAEELHKKIPEMGKAALMQVLYIPIQQGGMGFEQVQLANFVNQKIIAKPPAAKVKLTRDKYRDFLTNEEFEKKEVPEKRRLKGLVSEADAKSGEANFEEVENELEMFHEPKKE